MKNATIPSKFTNQSFQSQKEADEADRAYCRNLTPMERLQLMYELNRKAFGEPKYPEKPWHLVIDYERTRIFQESIDKLEKGKTD